ncbi:MAG: tetraacyldisaccharide 4'-kinase [Gammaproteobacteria bacterium]|nr:tetraacyldisaccharide 4'-kinase [Gammaproteobacteria bacterium]NNJ84123.1 tetraacyldisaccharide 4'-kinase [Gammaproteobacteria bacterium]
MFAPRLYFPAAWYKTHHPLGYALAPLSWLFRAAVSVRRFAYRHHLATVHHPGIPLVVVGNITTGGTGKTPLVIWLAKFLQEQGLRPAIVVRGYGGRANHWPQWVDANADPALVGDEAVLLARRTHGKVVASPNRVAAVRALMAHTDCNLILSDDGLQHYAMARDIEIAVVDKVSGYGNGRCLPAGPLREPISRLATVDFVMVNHGASQDLDSCLPGRDEYGMTLLPGNLRQVTDEEKERPADAFRGMPVHAVCGIGRPDRFFQTLRRLGLDIKSHAFPDHHPFRPKDVAFEDGLPVLMTEKDAVKCRRFADANHWYLSVDAAPESAFGTRLLTLLREMSIG